MGRIGAVSGGSRLPPLGCGASAQSQISPGLSLVQGPERKLTGWPVLQPHLQCRLQPGVQSGWFGLVLPVEIEMEEGPEELV